MTHITVAGCQLRPELGSIPENLARSEKLVSEAFSKGARWVLLPEFFPSGAAFHPALEGAALPLDGPATQLLQDAARRNHGFVGGSFICHRDGERFNTFVLADPEGNIQTHDKDMPTMWENCYYRGGSPDDHGVLETQDGRVGAVLCWEFLRWATAKRLLGNIDFVVGGSGWWTYPDLPVIRNLLARDQRRADAFHRESFARFARILGVPVVHAALAGPFRGRTPATGLPYPSMYLGETQIVDGRGEILARRSLADGEGVVVAEIEPGAVSPSEVIGDGFWIPKFPLSLSLSWHLFNAHGRRHYRRVQQRRRAER